MPEISQQSFWSGWQQRLNALRNIPPVLRIVWASGPPVIAAGLLFRVVSALIPVAMLSVSRFIIDAIVSSKAGTHALPQMFWWLVASEFALAALGSLLGRAILEDERPDHCRAGTHVRVRGQRRQPPLGQQEGRMG